MSEEIETVTVAGADGSPCRINRSDYDAAPAGTYDLMDFIAPVSTPTVTPISNGKLVVSKSGTKGSARYHLTDENGNRASNVAYDSETAAWNAILALTPNG
jgi:hypothetical protein